MTTSVPLKIQNLQLKLALRDPYFKSKKSGQNLVLELFNFLRLLK